MGEGGQGLSLLPGPTLCSPQLSLHPDGCMADEADGMWLSPGERSVFHPLRLLVSLTHPSLCPPFFFCCRPVSFPETPYTASPAGADKAPPYRQPSGSFSTPGSATYTRYKPSPERSESLRS